MMNNQKEQDLYDAFLSLRGKATLHDSFNVITINQERVHKLGCSHNGMPMFFIGCAKNETLADIRLNICSILFNRTCKITDTATNTSAVDTFSIIQLDSENEELIKYFIEVIALIINKLDSTPSVANLRSELLKVIRLFSDARPFSKETVRGLWAELLVIEQASNPSYLIQSWHVSPEDKYDFNDGQNKLEVKSTSREDRVHVFSLEQLNPNKGSELLVGSVFVNESGIGKSIFDLEASIQTKISDTSLILKLREVILATIGANITTCEGIYFDYKQGVETLSFFDAKAIPSIPLEVIPAQVSNVHFCSDLSEIASYSFVGTECELFKSL